jgi:hypothetical protein
MSATQPMTPPFKLRLVHRIVEPGTPLADVRAAIEAFNAETRLPGLDDRLNPDIVDADKAQALLAALPSLPPASLQPLAGRMLMLNADGLKLGASAPTSAADFGRPFDLQIEDVQGETVLGRVTVPDDLRLARQRAADAKAQLPAADQQVRALEARLQAAPTADQQGALQAELLTARYKRSALARCWRAHAKTISEQAGADAAAKGELDAATKAVSEYLVLPRTGMPPSKAPGGR